MDCYSCRWRVPCSGSAHSECHHPANKEALEDPMTKLFSIFASAGRMAAFSIKPPELDLELNEFGIKNGWCNYPSNFDPVWVNQCKGYEAKSKEGAAPKACYNLKTCDECENKYGCWTARV